MGNAGGSADEHAKRLIEEAGAWAAGAEGERRVAAALEDLPDTWIVVHDRLLRPGRSEANLDHIAIGPAGVFLIDAKNRAGMVTEHEGGLFQHRTRDGIRETVSLADELKKVHGMAAYMAAESDAAVVPVLCLAGSRADDFGDPRLVRGIWVVPVAALSRWLRARDVVIPSDRLAALATRVITEFPSTTTDVALLSAMGGAKGRGRAVRSRARRTPRSRPRRGRRTVSVFGRLAMLCVGVALFLMLLPRLPDILTRVFDAQPRGGAATSAAPFATGAPTGELTSVAKKGTATKRPAAPVSATPLGPPDCSDATAAEIKSIIHRTVRPIATRQGCAWGTRLDDATTELVSIVMTDDRAAYDVELATSVKQKRVVFGGAYDSTYRPATKASVASGQWIIRGAKPVRARADTVVVVATTKLGVSDDKARAMAVAIAAAASS
ncbi:nuclease-related domain-containing protein [Pedococcus sp. P5_B7]